MKRILKSAEEMFETVKSNVENGTEVNSGMVEYRDGKTILYVDDDKRIETYDILPEDVDFKGLAEEFIQLHSMSLDDFVNFYSEPNDVYEMEVHDAWFDYLRECKTADEEEEVGAEWEEFDEKKALSDFTESIRGKDLEWLYENYDVHFCDEHEGIQFYKVSNKDEEFPLKFEIRYGTSDKSISVSNAIAVADDDGDYIDYEVGTKVETTFNVAMVDESVLSLDEEQKITLELLKLAFKKAKESNLRIFHTPELGTFAYNGNKLQVDGISSWNDGKNFLFKNDSKLKVDFSDFDDVFEYWFGDESQGYGLLVSES